MWKTSLSPNTRNRTLSERADGSMICQNFHGENWNEIDPTKRYQAKIMDKVISLWYCDRKTLLTSKLFAPYFQLHSRNQKIKSISWYHSVYNVHKRIHLLWSAENIFSKTSDHLLLERENPLKTHLWEKNIIWRRSCDAATKVDCSQSPIIPWDRRCLTGGTSSSRAAVMRVLKLSCRHWSQLKMGPLCYTSKRTVRYTLQDKGDSTWNKTPPLIHNVSSEKLYLY